jgi:integrase
MGTRQLNRLSVVFLNGRRRPGYYCDGGGLYLQVTGQGCKSWIFRYRDLVTRKLRDMGLGSVQTLALADARTAAAAQRALLAADVDPIAARRSTAQRKALEAARTVTFAECAAGYIASHAPSWKNAKHGQQWANTLETYCAPVLGSLPVGEVDTALVLRVLEPIWHTKPETASRVRNRMENVLDWARARGYRAGENPARWKGHLNQLLPAKSARQRVKHHKAMPYAQVGAFLGALRERACSAALALEFTVLTATRTNEVLGALPEEFDLDSGVWIVPATRMKTGKEHRVPLSSRAVAIARAAISQGGQFAFSGQRPNRPLSNMAMLNLLERMSVDCTVHGFRSSFRDWAAEQTSFSHEVCEMTLAHTIKNAAEAAYRRGDLFLKRRLLMDAWSDFVEGPMASNKVARLRVAA